jgi:4-hydroxy-3-polyprenylbenzoate decarboxylase
MGIDATSKIPPETDHEWGEALESDPTMAARVTQRWAEYGLNDLMPPKGGIDPNLFGYEV